jgi:hypothetical protein
MKRSRVFFSFLVAMLAMGMLVLTGCPKDEDEEPPPPGPSEEDYEASGSFTSETGGTVETVSGARIAVPEGAVPLTTSGETGTMVFSIERDTELEVTAPSGETLASDVYRFSPYGFILAAPVQIAIPVLGEEDPEQVQIYRVNPTTGEYEPFGGVYDAETRTVSTQTYELSSWFITYPQSYDPWDWGCIHVMNISTEYWVRICFDSVNFEYPERDASYTYLSCLLAPYGHLGTASELLWPVPQGEYVLCVEFNPEGPSEEYEFYDTSYTVSDPWNLSNPTPVQFTVSGPQIPQNLGRCECNPIPTPSVGTGDVQVTLTWFNEQSIDLDLWVMDPDSEICAYWNPVTASGGELDRDNLCGNYINGRPENIFWSDAPAGEYIVYVDWFYDCGNDITSQSYNVRVYANAQAQTYTGTILPDETIEVTRFTVTGPTVMFGPFVGTPRDTKGIPRPKKES